MIPRISHGRNRKGLLSAVSLAVVVGISPGTQASTVTVIGTGGNSGQNGGVAQAIAYSGSGTDGNVFATAIGGNGGTGSVTNPNGGEGGAATASAFSGIGSPALIASSNIVVSATAIGGQGGYGDISAGGMDGNGGYATLGKVDGGSSILGAVVSVTGIVRGGNGYMGSLERLVNAVGGYADNGILSLTQSATGGSALNPGGSGGYASSVLNQNLAGLYSAPSSLTLNVSSTGGNGGAAGSLTSTGGQVQSIPGGNGGGTLSSAVGSLSGNGAVTISATAIGGNGGAADTIAGIPAGQGGIAKLGQVTGQSGTGAVSVSGTAVGGNGEYGANETLNNAVSGQTAGSLVLMQIVEAGNGVVDGGNAVSNLTDTSSESTQVTLTSQAEGGIGDFFSNTANLISYKPQDGTALADAGGSAVLGTANAFAIAHSNAENFVQSILTQTSAPLAPKVVQNVESSASIGQSLRSATYAAGLQAASYATGFTSITAPTAGNAVELGSALLQAGGITSPSAYTASATWVFNPENLWVPGRDLIIALSNVEYTGDGLVSCKILLNNVLAGGIGEKGAPVNFATAQNYFSLPPIDLGSLAAMPQNSTLEFLLSVTSTNNGVFDPTINFYNGSTSSVPEPRALATLLLGTLPIILRRRRKTGT